MRELPEVLYAGPSVYEAMSKAMEEVRAVGKDSVNTQQHFNFRGIDAVVNAASPAFRNHGIITVPQVRSISYRDTQTTTGKPAREVTVQVAYRFYGPGGDYIEAITPGESMDSGDKGTAKAMSVAYRIALLQVLCIPTTDTDPDAESYERANEPPRDWKGEAEKLTNVDELKALGNTAYEKGQLSDELKNFIAGRIAELSKPDPDVEQAKENLANAGLVGSTSE